MILLRLALRRDRVLLPVWLYALVAVVIGTAASFRSLYPNAAARDQFAQALAGNTAITAIYGPLPAPASLGELVAWRSLVLGGIALAGLMILLVIRHSRAEEQSGALELLAATAIRRRDPLIAALATAGITMVVLDVALVAGCTVVGLPIAGGMNYAGSWTGLALVFAGVAAVTAQLAESPRAARGIGFVVLGLSYLLRMLGDAGAGWLSWLSPLGWAQSMHPFAGDRWWPVLIPMIVGAGLLRLAFLLQNQRDLGAGLLATRAGKPVGGVLLRSTTGLHLRTARAGWLGWLLAVLGFGALFGGVAASITALADSQSTRTLLAQLGGSTDLADGFIGSALNAGGLILTGYGIATLIAAQSEESSGRLDLLLAASVTRTRWFTGQFRLAGLGTGALLAALGLAAGVARGEPGRILLSALVQVPAAWTIIGVSAMLYGLNRSGAALGWALLGGCAVLGLLGPVLHFPRWLLDVSPFSHTPTAPGQPLSAISLVILLALAALSSSVGVVLFNRRDLG